MKKHVNISSATVYIWYLVYRMVHMWNVIMYHCISLSNTNLNELYVTHTLLKAYFTLSLNYEWQIKKIIRNSRTERERREIKWVARTTATITPILNCKIHLMEMENDTKFIYSHSLPYTRATANYSGATYYINIHMSVLCCVYYTVI